MVIDFSLSQEEELARGAARDFAVRRLSPAVRAHEKDGVPQALQAEFAALGIGRADVSAELGGAGLGPLAQALVLEELAAVDVAAALALDGCGPARYPVLELGDAEAQREVLGKRAALWVAPEVAQEGDV